MKLSDFIQKDTIEFHCPYPANDQPDWFAANQVNGITIQNLRQYRRFHIDLRVISLTEIKPSVTVESHRETPTCFDGCIFVYFLLPDVTFLECHLSPLLIEGRPMAMVRLMKTIY